MARQQTDAGESEHRSNDRFPIESLLRYKLVDWNAAPATGAGRTLNMSSGGILFSAPVELPVGGRVELSVDWPAKLNEQCALTLVAVGRIIRSNAETAAIHIEKYDFRTRAAAASAASAGLAL